MKVRHTTGTEFEYTVKDCPVLLMLGNVLEMTHICGAAGEKVALQTHVPTNVEAHMCLSQLGDSICNTLREQLQKCCAEWPEPMDKATLGQWVESFPSQCVLAAFAIHSTDQIMKSLRSIAKRERDKNARCVSTKLYYCNC